MPPVEIGVVLDAHPRSVGRARTLVRAALGAAFDPDAAVLVTSELVTNAVRHAHRRIRLTLSVLRDTIRLEVSDDGDGTPAQKGAADLDTGGRGLALVTLLSRRWGVRPLAIGKTVWCDLPTVPLGCPVG